MRIISFFIGLLLVLMAPTFLPAQSMVGESSIAYRIQHQAIIHPVDSSETNVGFDWVFDLNDDDNNETDEDSSHFTESSLSNTFSCWIDLSNERKLNYPSYYSAPADGQELFLLYSVFRL